jgi:hypothetical protein
MKTITRRLCRLERTLGVVETERTRYLVARLEDARRRMSRLGYPQRTPEDVSGLTMEQILNRGRERAAKRTISEEAAEGFR